MNRTAVMVGLMLVAACSSEAAQDDSLGESNDEIRQKNIACASPRLTREGYRGEGSFVGNDGQVYVTAKVCMQDDDNGDWAQCDAEEGGGDWNGGPKGDWYGFWDTGEPMRGPCKVKIPLAGNNGGSSSGGTTSSSGGTTDGAQCKTAAHGRVNVDTCFQEPDWKWYRCDAGGVTNGAAGPNAAGCAVTLWYSP
jgi:hypothetical protein